MQDWAPTVRQLAVLLLKRYICTKSATQSKGDRGDAPTVLALTCANLAAKYFHGKGIEEQKLHFMTHNTYTRRDFVTAEIHVLQALDGEVYWPGVLLADWTRPLLLIASRLLADGNGTVNIIDGLVAHLSDILQFQDELMVAHRPSELAAALLHAAVTLGTKKFQRSAFAVRIGHLCRLREEPLITLSERILIVCLGNHASQLILEGSGFTAEDSDLQSGSSASSQSSPVSL